MRSLPTIPTLEDVEPKSGSAEPGASSGSLDAKAVGMRLRLSRKRARLTQGQLGEMIGRGAGAVSHYETGHRHLPTEAIRLICERLEVSQDWLLHGAGPGPGSPPKDQAERPNSDPPAQNRITSHHGFSPADEARLHAAIARIPVQVATQWVACPHCSLTGLRRQHLPVHFLSGNCIQRWEDGDLLEMTMAAQVDPEPWELAMVEAQKKIERSREMIKAAGLNLKKRAAWKRAYELNLQLLETIDANGPENYRHGHARVDGGAF